LPGTGRAGRGGGGPGVKPDARGGGGVLRPGPVGWVWGEEARRINWAPPRTAARELDPPPPKCWHFMCHQCWPMRGGRGAVLLRPQHTPTTPAYVCGGAAVVRCGGAGREWARVRCGCVEPPRTQGRTCGIGVGMWLIDRGQAGRRVGGRAGGRQASGRADGQAGGRQEGGPAATGGRAVQGGAGDISMRAGAQAGGAQAGGRAGEHGRRAGRAGNR